LADEEVGRQIVLNGAILSFDQREPTKWLKVASAGFAPQYVMDEDDFYVTRVERDRFEKEHNIRPSNMAKYRMNPRNRNKSRITSAQATVVAAIIGAVALILANMIPITCNSNFKETINEEPPKIDEKELSTSSQDNENDPELRTVKREQQQQSPSDPDTTTYHSVSTNRRILILIEQSNQFDVRGSLAEEVLSGEFSKAGFDPVTESDIGSENAQIVRDAIRKTQFTSLSPRLLTTFEIIVFGEISVQPLSDVQGMKIFIAKGLVKAVSVKIGSSLGIKTLNDVRGFGNSEVQAAESAIKTAALEAAETIVGSIK
jgi:hypothetical protein